MQGQIEEIKRLSQQIQYDMSNSQNKAHPYQDILRNLETKINVLQDELKLLERNSVTPTPQQPLINAYVPITSTNYLPYQTNGSNFNYNPANLPLMHPITPTITNYQVSNTINSSAPLTQTPIQVSNQEKIKSSAQPIHDDKQLKLSEYNPSPYAIDPKTTPYAVNSQLNSQVNPSNLHASQYAGLSTVDYYGDPKVKAIIDEVNLNKSIMIL